MLAHLSFSKKLEAGAALFIFVVRIFHAAALVQVRLAGRPDEARIHAGADETAFDVGALAAVSTWHVQTFVDVDAGRVGIPAHRCCVTGRTRALVRTNSILAERRRATVVLLLGALVDVVACFPVTLESRLMPLIRVSLAVSSLYPWLQEQS
jgi:hypothetical protein